MAAGDRAAITGSGQGLPGTTPAVIDVGSVTDPDNILTETQAGRYRPDSEGYYLIVGKGWFQLTHNNRLQINWGVYKNGTLIDGSQDSKYGRNSSNDEFTPKCAAIEHFNGTSDYFEIFDERDNGNGTPAGSYQDTYVEVIQLTEGAASATPYGRYDAPAAAAHSGSTPTQVTDWDVVSETDTDVIELQAGDDAIRLKEANRPYLILPGS